MTLRSLALAGFLLVCMSCTSAHQIVDDAKYMTEMPPMSVVIDVPRVAHVSSSALSRSSMSAASSSESSRVFRVPIVMYHYVRPLPENDPLGVGLSVSPETFAHQLGVYARKSYTTIGFRHLVDSGSALPTKPIILTFDDGYEDAYTQAFPLLVAHGMTATFYIVTDFVGTAGYVTWDQLREMRDAGMEIAAHTAHHYELSKLSEAQQRAQIQQSITTLEQTLGVRIDSLAYPAGRYNEETVKIMRSTTVPFAVTTRAGVAKGDMNPYELPRVRVNDKTDMEKTF